MPHVYDLETAGADPSLFTPVLQCAIAPFDADFVQTADVRRIDVAVGLDYANPGAAAVNGIAPRLRPGPGQHTPLEGADAVARQAYASSLECPGDALYGFNNLHFDAPLMRHWLYGLGQDPDGWTAGRLELDVAQMAYLAHVLRVPVSFSPSESHGCFSFGLQALAYANGLKVDGDAHEAGADLRLTAELARHIQAAASADARTRMEDAVNGAAHRAARQSDGLLAMPVSGVNGRVYATPLLTVPTGTGLFGWRTDKKQHARIAKFLGLDPDARAGMLARPHAERPRGFRSQSSSGLPFRRLRRNAPLLLNTDELLDEQARDELRQAQKLLGKHGLEAASMALRAAVEGGSYYASRETDVDPRNRVLRLNADDLVQRHGIVGRILDRNRRADVAPAAEAAVMSADADTHRKLIGLWKWEQHFAEGGEVGAMAAYASSSPERGAEVREVCTLLAERLAGVDDRCREDVEELRRKSPATALNGRDMLREAMAHNTELAQLGARLEGLGQSLQRQPTGRPPERRRTAAPAP